MPEIIDKVAAATAELAQLQAELQSLEQSARAHEQASRDARLQRDEVKAKIAATTQVLQHSAVHARVMSAEEATQAAKASAEEILARLAEKEARLDELLAANASKETSG